MICSFAIKNLICQRKRYVMMSVAIMIGFFMITILTSLMSGAIETIKSKAARYFSGQLCVIGLNGPNRDMENPQEIMELFTGGGYRFETVAMRSVFTNEMSLFYNGSYARIRKTIGVDFEAERPQLEKLPFISGGIGDGILISRAITDDLGIQVGDEIVVSFTTVRGVYNTAVLPVAGIFDELNIFGYCIYVDRKQLNRMLQLPENFVTELALYTRKGENINALARTVADSLARSNSVVGIAQNRSEFEQFIYSVPSGTRTFVIATIEAQLEQIATLLSAITFLMYFVLIVFLLITVAGIINTYGVIIYERRKEIGTMRAIGMHKKTVRNLFLCEALFLTVFSVCISFAISVVTLQLCRVFTIENIPAANMFMEYGRLQYYVDGRQLCVNVVFIMLSVLFAVLRPAMRAASISPAEVLRM